MADAISASLCGRRMLVLLPVVLAAVLLLVGMWTRHLVDGSIEGSLRSHLTTLLDADVEALRLWIDGERDFAEACAASPALSGRVETLAATALAAADPRTVILESTIHDDVLESLAPLREAGDYQGVIVIHSSGLILAADGLPHLVGRRLSATGLSTMAACFDGRSAVLRPYLEAELLETVAPTPADPDQFAARVTQLMFVTAPIRDSEARVIAALAVRVDPQKDFTRILSVARSGETGETYAFNREGYLLSGCRFQEQLRALDLLPDDEGDVSYAIQLRDPGVDLTRGHRPTQPLSERPMTRMAARATAGHDGVDLGGYPDYRGIVVVGAWRWLGEYDFGVATEVDHAEAYSTLNSLRTAFLALITLLVGTSGVILGSTWIMRSYARRIDEVAQLGQYTLVRKIGEGGMGTVYLARHAMLQRPTALKTLRTDALSPDNIERFEREVQLTSQLTHPNTIEIYDFGRSPDGVFYYAMEYLEGLTLARLITMEGRIPPARIIFILKQVCGSLEEAHAVGLVHRDVKPPNIMLCQRGLQTDVVKVLDFGLVREIEAPPDRQGTNLDLVGGTPPYIAPERLRDPRLMDPRSDLFSVGAIAYAMLTGREIFTGDSSMDVCSRVLHETPPPPSEVMDGDAGSKQLERLIMALLERDRDRRPESAAALIERLDAVDDAGDWGPAEARAWWAANRQRIVDAGSGGGPLGSDDRPPAAARR